MINGTTRTSFTAPHTEPVQEPFFEGPVCFLIGKRTFSSANMTANAVKDFQLATLIGETTAEPANDYGNLEEFVLPNTKIEARCPINSFIRANGDARDFDGIKPDIEVVPTAQDIIHGRDPVLARAQAWLAEQAAGRALRP